MTAARKDVVVRTYSARAGRYDEAENLGSCWGAVADRALTRVGLRPSYRSVVEVGCGSGHALERLAQSAPAEVQFIGVEPADGMRAAAEARLADLEQVRIVNGRFEKLPLDEHSVDYLFSVLAFHWTTDVAGSIVELRRVLRPGGDMDLFFTGRHTGREFTRKTTPIFLRYLGPAVLLQSAGLRKHLTLDATREAFGEHFDPATLEVEESYETHHDDLDGHWSWWVARAAAHFDALPAERREACDRDVREAIGGLAEERGIPYTVHLLHVRVRG